MKMCTTESQVKFIRIGVRCKMKLTICLITMGRPEFLEPCLKGIEGALVIENVNVILVDNGSKEEVASKLKSWSCNNHEKVKYLRLEKNESRAHVIWKLLEKEQIEWIVFPGDDDVFESKFIEKFFRLVQKNPKLSALGASAELINKDGKSLDQIKFPPLHEIDSRPKQIVKSLHEAPFFWPSLFLHFPTIDKNIVDMKYVADWSVGVQAVIQGRFLTTNEISLKYRVHPSQESFSSVNHRKFFEAAMMITSTIEGNDFRTLLNSFSFNDAKIFFDFMIKVPPIYGDTFYRERILNPLRDVIIESGMTDHIMQYCLGRIMEMSGVFIRMKEIVRIFSLPHKDFYYANLNFDAVNGVCDEFSKRITEFPNNRAFRTFRVKCSHSKSNSSDFTFDCSHLANLDQMQLFDLLIVELSKKMEASGELRFTVTSGEIWVIRTLRFLRRYIPSHVSSFFSTLKGKGF